MLALTTCLPQARGATPEELSRQYSDDMVSALGGVLVPQTSQDLARARRIVERLALALGDEGWNVLVYRLAAMPKHMDVPAFALPGKHIAVSDWAARKYSDNALAFTIAHEMGHMALDHQSEIFRATMECAHIHPRKWTVLAAHSGCAVPLMREQELQADTFGYALAEQAGFDARKGARELLQRLNDDDMHPAVAVRLKQLGIESFQVTPRKACRCSPLKEPAAGQVRGGDLLLGESALLSLTGR
ncbi:M48 family metalloprotease [Paraburkholderia sp. MM5477-R1]|uniref:M48 family metalloprotease n=1 Tax=Paraburkholderia sp. MM5477-R1 TaxID=2991062 RepID=UPI003D1EB8E7